MEWRWEQKKLLKRRSDGLLMVFIGALKMQSELMKYRDENFCSLPSAAWRGAIVSGNARKSAFLLPLNLSARPFMTFLCRVSAKSTFFLQNTDELIKPNYFMKSRPGRSCLWAAAASSNRRLKSHDFGNFQTDGTRALQWLGNKQ